MASSVNHTVRLPRWTNAASYSGQFATRYRAFGILWRRLSLNLYGMELPELGVASNPAYNPSVIPWHPARSCDRPMREIRGNLFPFFLSVHQGALRQLRPGRFGAERGPVRDQPPAAKARGRA